MSAESEKLAQELRDELSGRKDKSAPLVVESKSKPVEVKKKENKGKTELIG